MVVVHTSYPNLVLLVHLVKDLRVATVRLLLVAINAAAAVAVRVLLAQMVLQQVRLELVAQV